MYSKLIFKKYFVEDELMKVRLLILLLFISSTAAYSQPSDSIKVIPLKIDKQRCIKHWLGRYHSTVAFQKKGFTFTSHTGLDGTRITVGDNGEFSLIKTTNLVKVDQSIMETLIKDTMTKMGVNLSLLLQIVWKYENSDGHITLTGIKSYDGIEVLFGDIIELSIIKVNDSQYILEFHFLWFEELLSKNKSLVQKKDVSSTSIPNKDYSYYYILENGYYHRKLIKINKKVKHHE